MLAHRHHLLRQAMGRLNSTRRSSLCVWVHALYTLTCVAATATPGYHVIVSVQAQLSAHTHRQTIGNMSLFKGSAGSWLVSLEELVMLLI